MTDIASKQPSSMLDETAFALANSLFKQVSNSAFSDLQYLVFQQAWRGRTYQEIADEAGYEHDYIKQIGSQIWRSLSKATGEPVSKSNIHSVFRRVQQTQPVSVIRDRPPAYVDKGSHLNSVEGQEIRWVGRDALVQSLGAKLQGEIRVLSLVGITGIGKSSLAIRLTLDPGISHIWQEVSVIRCDHQANTFDLMARGLLGDHLLQSEEIQKAPKQLVYALIQYLEKNPILIILDMVEEILTSDQRGINSYTESQFEIFFEEFLKSDQMRSRLILTSQQQPPMVSQGRYSHRYHLERLVGLSGSEALQLFRLWDVEPKTDTELNYLDRFSKGYEGHPLALQVIAGEIRENPYKGNVQAYWNDFGCEIETLEQDLNISQDRAEKVEHNLSGYSINLIDLVEQRVIQSFERLRLSHPLAHLLLCMGSVYRRSVEREGWLFLIGDSPKSEQLGAFQTLQRRFLIEEDLGDDRVQFRLHSLIRSVANQQLNFLDADSDE